MPVVAIPCTKYFCREKNRIKRGIIDSVAIANAPPQLDTAPASPTNVRNALDTLKISRIGEVQQVVEKVVPRPKEREQRDRHQSRARERYDDTKENPDFPAPVDGRRLVELFRQTAYELHEQKHEERVRREEFRHDDREVRTHPPEGVEQDIARHES